MTLFDGETPALSPGSTVVVTGANSFIAAHVCDQLLSLGYRVRGTVRDKVRCQWVSDAFESKYPGLFELVEVKALGEPGVFDKLLIGASGLAHIATEATNGYDPTVTIPATIKSTLNVLEAAARSESVKRLVLTSSSSTVYTPSASSKKAKTISSNDWNIEVVAKALAPPPYEPERWADVYGASKTLSERALWKAWRESDTALVVNTVAPDTMLGPCIDPKHKSSTAQILFNAWESGDGSLLKPFAIYSWFVDVRDTARLHVAGLLDPKVKNEKLLGYAHKYNEHQLVKFFEELDVEQGTQRQLVPASTGNWICIDEVDTGRSEEALRRLGQDGWIARKKTLREALGV